MPEGSGVLTHGVVGADGSGVGNMSARKGSRATDLNTSSTGCSHQVEVSASTMMTTTRNNLCRNSARCRASVLLRGFDARVFVGGRDDGRELDVAVRTAEVSCAGLVGLFSTRSRWLAIVVTSSGAKTWGSERQ